MAHDQRGFLENNTATAQSDSIVIKRNRYLLYLLSFLSIDALGRIAYIPFDQNSTHTMITIIVNGAILILLGYSAVLFSRPIASLSNDGVVCPDFFDGVIPWGSVESIDYTGVSLRLKLTAAPAEGRIRSYLWRGDPRLVVMVLYNVDVDDLAALAFCRARIDQNAGKPDDPTGVSAQAAHDANLAGKRKRYDRFIYILAVVAAALAAAGLGLNILGHMGRAAYQMG